VALLCLYSEAFSLAVKFFVDVFAVSRSGTKTYLLCVYLMCFGLAPAGIAAWSSGVRRRLVPILGLLLVALLGLGLYEYLVLVDRMGLAVDYPAIFVFNGDVASSELYHNHVSKMPLSILLYPLLSGTFLYEFESGFVFLEHFSWALLFGHAGLYMAYLASLWLASLLAGQLCARWFLVYVLASFTLMKNVLDGGLFYFETSVALVFFVPALVSLYRPNCRGPRALVVGGSLLVGAVVTWIGGEAGPTMEHVWKDLLPLLGIYGVLWCAGIALEQRRRGVAASVGVAGMLAYAVAIFHFGHWSPVKQPLLRAMSSLPPGAELSLMIRGSLNDADQLLEVVGSETFGSLTHVHVRTRKRILYRALGDMGLNLHFYDISRHGYDCDPRRHRIVRFGLRGDVQAMEAALAERKETFPETIEEVRIWSFDDDRGEMKLRMNTCLPLPLDVAAYVLGELDAGPVVLIPTPGFPLI